MKAKKILIVHQGYELYGSDRMLLLSLSAIRNFYPDAFIEVRIPQKGDLSEEIERLQIVDLLKIKKTGVIRKSDIRRGNFSILYYITYGLWKTYKELKEYDIVYINSIVIIDFLILSLFVKNKFILHIHEIPVGFSKMIFKAFVLLSNAKVVAISHEVKKYFKRLDSIVIHNGVIGYSSMIKKGNASSIKMLIIGRINSWKGQDFFLEAFGQLPTEIRSCFDIRIVGDVFEDQVYYKTKLENIVNKYNISDLIHFYPFVDNPGFHYHWADIVVVPSKRPEPFGLVAIEGMSAGCPILAANHGGLKEIVEDNFTGWLFEPNDNDDLINHLIYLVHNRDKIHSYGEQARIMFQELYSSEAFVKRLKVVFQ
jgi:glycosyltransferase involved in cell wall biosynthesis